MATNNNIRAAVAAANQRHPLILWPAVLTVILWAMLVGVLILHAYQYYGGVQSYMYIPIMRSFFLVLPIVYFTFLPGIVAWYRRHPSRKAVAWMNLLCFIPFLGWVFWIGLMFYAALSGTDRIVPVAYGEGSIVNGYVLHNNEWVRL